MSRKEKNIKTLKKDILINRLRLILIGALMVTIFYPPYLQGLFFEKHVLPTQILVFTIFIVFLIYKWLKNDNVFFKTPIDYVCLGFVVVYFISIFVAVHTRSAIIEWLKYCMYFAVFYMISDLTDTPKIKLLFLWTIVISAVGVSIIGIDASMGGNIVRTLNNIFKVLGVKGDLFFGLFVNNRIHSTLQYPNALASYLMAVFFVTVGLLIVHDKWWQKIILGNFAFILFSTFMLTQSRGAQLLFPVAIIILFISTPKYNRIKVISHVLLLAIPAGIISLIVSQYLSTDTLLKPKVTLLFLIGLLVTLIISLVIKYIGDLLQRISWRIHVVIISVFIIIGAIGASYILNSSIPGELSLLNSEENRTVSISKDIVLQPNKEYILRFKADGKMKEEKPYAFDVKIHNKTLNNILFGGSEQLLRKDFLETDGLEEFDLLFNTKQDTKLINVNFSIYYAGTSVKIETASIIDSETGKTVKKIILKNKYNLDNILSRFQNILLQPSLVTRFIFYKDGIKILKNNWFFGSGGGAWNYLYRKHQSYNYSSSQAHNYPLQLGIETGILGIIILFSLILVIAVYYIKYYKDTKNFSYSNQGENLNSSICILNSSVITSIAALLMHSVIDFDFSESSMLLLFWQLTALFNRELIDNNIKLNNVKKKPKSCKYDINGKGKLLFFIGVFVSVTTLYFSLTFVIASSFARQSFEYLQNNDIEKAVNKMEKAIILDRYNEKYVLGYNPIPSRLDIKAGLIDILFMKNEIYKNAQKNGEMISENDLRIFEKQFSRTASYIKDIEKKAKNNLSLTTDLASYYFRIGEIEKGINYINYAINYFPFEPSLWHSKINVYYQLMREYFNEGDYETAKEFLLKGLSVINEVKEINKKNMNPFVFNQNTVDLLQTMKFMLDNWNTSEIYDVNEVVCYSLFDLDIDMNSIPDQWRISNEELLSVSISGEDLSIQASGKAYIVTYYPIKVEKGKTYQILVKTKKDVDNLSYFITWITAKDLPLVKDGDKYSAELKIEIDPREYGNLLRIYVEEDCVIESIIVKELK